MEIRSLHEGDDRAPFRSGDDDLDRFFHRFATVAPGHIEIEDLPPSLRRKLPHYPLPVLRLARLAVDETARQQGLGAVLLRFVLRLALRMAADYGCVGVVVDAKPGATTFYEKFGFTPLQAVQGQSDTRPQATPMFLSIRAIAGA